MLRILSNADTKLLPLQPKSQKKSWPIKSSKGGQKWTTLVPKAAAEAWQLKTKRQLSGLSLVTVVLL